MLIMCWAPWILQAQSTRISVIFLEHSLGQIVPIMILTGLVYPVSSGTLYRIVQTSSFFCPFFLGSNIQDRLLHVKWRLKDPNHNRKTHYDPSGHGDISTFVSSRDRWYVPYSAHLGSPAKGPGLLSYNALARQFRWSWLWVWNGRSCGCLVPSPLYCARPMQFGWRGPSEFFVSDNSPKCIEREGLERHRTGTREGLVVRSIGKCGSRIKILKSGIRILQ